MNESGERGHFVHFKESFVRTDSFANEPTLLYTFVSGSPERWAIYKEQTGCSLHRLSDTRWSARIEAVKPVAKHLPSVLKSLDSIVMTCSLTSEARSEANGLRKYFMSFDAVVLLTVWLKVLQSIDNRNVILQSGKISLDIEAANIRDLTEEMQSLRDAWDTLLAEAKLIAGEINVTPQLSKESSRQKKRRRFHDETAEEETTQDSSETVFRNTVFYTAMDSIISDLDTRFRGIAHIVNEFSAVLKVGQISEGKISSVCQPLITKYSSDLTPDFENQVRHLNSVYAANFPPNLSPLELLNAICKLQLQSIFGEVCIALRIFCTLPVTVAGGERAFSKLKMIKNYLRSTMSPERLCSLAMLSIESQLARKLDFKDLISDIAHEKARRWAFGEKS